MIFSMMPAAEKLPTSAAQSSSTGSHTRSQKRGAGPRGNGARVACRPLVPQHCGESGLHLQGRVDQILYPHAAAIPLLPTCAQVRNSNMDETSREEEVAFSC